MIHRTFLKSPTDWDTFEENVIRNCKEKGMLYYINGIPKTFPCIVFITKTYEQQSIWKCDCNVQVFTFTIDDLKELQS